MISFIVGNCSIGSISSYILLVLFTVVYFISYNAFGIYRSCESFIRGSEFMFLFYIAVVKQPFWFVYIVSKFLNYNARQNKDEFKPFFLSLYVFILLSVLFSRKYWIMIWTSFRILPFRWTICLEIQNNFKLIYFI